jgi:hypothetical protein
MKFLIIPLFLVGCSGVGFKDTAPSKPERPTTIEYTVEADDGRIIEIIDKSTNLEAQEESEPFRLHPIWLFIGFILLTIGITQLSLMMDKGEE